MTIIDAVFNTGFAESIASMIKKTAYVNIGDQLKGSLSGNKMVKIEYSDAFGNAINDFQSQPKSGKADASLSNIKMHVDVNNSKIKGQLSINIGISNKFYRTKHFKNMTDKITDATFSSGSGGTLEEALLAVFSHNMRALYYSYNIFGHQSDFNDSLVSLKDVIATRQIVRLFASRGGNSDFAQFMFINGQIIPIWNIIMNTTNDVMMANNALNLKIENEASIENIATTMQKTPLDRIIAVNKAIGDATISMELNLNKLLYFS